MSIQPKVIKSPCNNICTMQTPGEARAAGQAEALCKGCARTINEIARWSQMSDAQKLALLAELKIRSLT